MPPPHLLPGDQPRGKQSRRRCRLNATLCYRPSRQSAVQLLMSVPFRRRICQSSDSSASIHPPQSASSDPLADPDPVTPTGLSPTCLLRERVITNVSPQDLPVHVLPTPGLTDINDFYNIP